MLLLPMTGSKIFQLPGMTAREEVECRSQMCVHGIQITSFPTDQSLPKYNANRLGSILHFESSGEIS